MHTVLSVIFLILSAGRSSVASCDSCEHLALLSIDQKIIERIPLSYAFRLYFARIHLVYMNEIFELFFRCNKGS